MKKILNPYTKLDGYNCFGCSPKNAHGLKMNFFEDGDYVISSWKPVDFLQGYHNILHGGIQATLMDEIASWFVQIKMKTAGVTANMNIKYINPVSVVEGNITLKASLIQIRRNLVDVKVKLFDANNKLCATADITYYTFPKEEAKKKFYYPEYKEFFENNDPSK